MLKLLIVAAIVWWFFLRKANAAAASTVIQGAGPDFDPVTADQLNAAASGDVNMGDDWTATFITGNGNWSYGYRTHADEEPEQMLGLPL